MKLNKKRLLLSGKRLLKVLVAGVVPVAANAVAKQVLPQVQSEIVALIPEAVKPLAMPFVASMILAAQKYFAYYEDLK